jgi:hypothetical protein
MANNDFLTTDDDLLIQGGDLVTGASDQQHVADTIVAFPGWWKENPQDGVGLSAYLNSAGKEQEITRKLRVHLTSDGYRVGNPNVQFLASGQLYVDPQATAL